MPRASGIFERPEALRARPEQPQAARGQRSTPGFARAPSRLGGRPSTFPSRSAWWPSWRWSRSGRYSASTRVLRGQLEDTRALMSRGSLVQPATETSVHVSPDHAPGIDRARILVSRTAPQLMDVHIDLGYTNKLSQFRVFVDKQDPGPRAGVNNVLKRLQWRTEGHPPIPPASPAGIYNVRIEAIPFRGSPRRSGLAGPRSALRRPPHEARPSWASPGEPSRSRAPPSC